MTPDGRSPRVAFVSFAFGEYSIRLASALTTHAEVGLWLSEWQAGPHMERLASAVVFHGFAKPRMRQPVAQVRTISRLLREIRRFEPDIVHLQQGYLWFNPALTFLRQYPLVVTVHDPIPHVGDRLGNKTPQFIADRAYREANALIVHNEQMREVIAARAVTTAPVHVIPHVALGGGNPGSVSEDGNEILFFGRIWPYKGLEYLIQAQPLITASVPDARIIIAGHGEDFARYRQQMSDPERFEVINEFIPQERIAELFLRASVIALPYIEATQSGVIPMAYSYGRPVVATTVGGLPAMVDDGETGYLVAPRDVPGLADAIIRLLKDPALRTRLGAGGRHKVETEFSAETVAAATTAVYRDVLAGQR